MGDITIKILKQFNFDYAKLRDYNKNILETGKPPDFLKMANVVLEQRNNEPTDKDNYRRINLLPLLSKIFERLIHK